MRKIPTTYGVVLIVGALLLVFVYFPEILRGERLFFSFRDNMRTLGAILFPVVASLIALLVAFRLPARSVLSCIISMLLGVVSYIVVLWGLIQITLLLGGSVSNYGYAIFGLGFWVLTGILVVVANVHRILKRT